MSEIISFESRKHEVLCDALEKAEAAVARLAAEMERLRAAAAPYARQLQTSMDLDRARQAERRSQRAFARFCGAEVEPETPGVAVAQVIALAR